MGIVTFTNNRIRFSLKNKLLLKTFLASIFAEEGFEFKSVSYIFCSDDFLLKLNQKYLNHDTYTDILTFTLSGSLLPIVSEIYISIERVEDNAQKLNVRFERELSRVMVHGILHLCNYEDAIIEQKRIIRNREDYYLSKLDS